MSVKRHRPRHPLVVPGRLATPLHLRVAFAVALTVNTCALLAGVIR